MDDGDGALSVEMMAGQPDQAILQTIYNGTAACPGCGCLVSPIMTLYTGGMCADCVTRKSARNANRLLGR